MSTKLKIEDNFWEMIVPNKYYLAITKLSSYDYLGVLIGLI